MAYYRQVVFFCSAFYGIEQVYFPSILDTLSDSIIHIRRPLLSQLLTEMISQAIVEAHNRSTEVALGSFQTTREGSVLLVDIISFVLNLFLSFPSHLLFILQVSR